MGEFIFPTTLLEFQRAFPDEAACAAALSALREAAASPDGRLMQPILQAVKARSTVGEIGDTLRAVWGTFHRGR